MKIIILGAGQVGGTLAENLVGEQNDITVVDTNIEKLRALQDKGWIRIEYGGLRVLDLQAFGMQLHWLGYGGYRARHQAGFWEPWLALYPGFSTVPEGGGGLPGALGCAALLSLARRQLAGLGWDDYDGWWLAVGTGTTLAGLLLAEAGAHPVYGALAVPADHGVQQQVQAIVQAGGLADGSCRLLEACRGGFAAVDDELLEFIFASEAASGLPLEPLYTGKALMALRRQVEAGYFARGSRLLFVHTGGLQGRTAALQRYQQAGRLD